MAVSITPKFSKADIQKMLAKKKQVIEKVIISRFQRIGETFITNARNNNTYTDQTGNLKSSIGYVILKDGEQIFGSSFEQVKEGIKGTKAGPKLTDEVSKKYTRGFVLIVVAGMEYALYVEAKGYDVLTASSIAAENDLKKAVEQISKKV